MTDFVLFGAPGSCARVSAICLEEAGAAFESRLVRIMIREQKSLQFKRINPKGKVPALLINNEVLTENVAIILHLNSLFPQSRLLPPAASELEAARQIADLCFCSATLHPMVTRIRMPQRFAAPEAKLSVFEKGCDALSEYFQLVEDRLQIGPWWYGADWSAMDAYLYWVFWRVKGAGFRTGPYPKFSKHALQMESRPAVQRALARESAAQRQLESEGNVANPSSIP